MSQTEEAMDVADVGDNSVKNLTAIFYFLFTASFISCTTNKTIYSQNGSSSDTTSSRGKEGDFESKIETDRSKRFEFLLKQTEIFSHFMTNAPKSNSPPKPKAGRPKKNKDLDTSGGAGE